MKRSSKTQSSVKRLQRYKHLLSNFDSFNTGQKKIIKNNLNLDLVKLITEIVYNIQSGNIELNTEANAKLDRYRNKMKSLFSPRNNTLSKKKKIIQSGGFIATLLSVLGSELVGYLLNKL